MPRLVLFLFLLCFGCTHRQVMRDGSYTTLVRLANHELANTWRIDVPANEEINYIFYLHPDEPYVIFLSPQADGEMRILIDADPGMAYRATGSTTTRSSTHFSSADRNMDPHFDFGGNIDKWQSSISWTNAQTGGDDGYIVARNYGKRNGKIKIRAFIRSP